MIVPAIIPRTLRHLKESVAQVPNAPAVQVDVVDGRFVSFTSWPYQGGVRHFDLREPLPVAVEVDLMVCDALPAAKEWVAAGAKRLVVHIESVDDETLQALIKLRSQAVKVGLSLANDTPLEAITTYLPVVDFIQLMGIANLGAQGQPFDERVLERIAILKRQHPKIEIAVDGSVTEATLPRLKDAGADRFAVGSGIFGAPDPSAAYEQLTALEAAL